MSNNERVYDELEALLHEDGAASRDAMPSDLTERVMASTRDALRGPSPEDSDVVARIGGAGSWRPWAAAAVIAVASAGVWGAVWLGSGATPNGPSSMGPGAIAMAGQADPAVTPDPSDVEPAVEADVEAEAAALALVFDAFDESFGGWDSAGNGSDDTGSWESGSFDVSELDAWGGVL